MALFVIFQHSRERPEKRPAMLFALYDICGMIARVGYNLNIHTTNLTKHSRKKRNSKPEQSSLQTYVTICERFSLYNYGVFLITQVSFGKKKKLHLFGQIYAKKYCISIQFVFFVRIIYSPPVRKCKCCSLLCDFF